MTLPDLNGDDEPPTDTGSLRHAVRLLTDEVHACTHDLGVLSAEVAELSARVHEIEGVAREARRAAFETLAEVQKIGERMAKMRQKLTSVTDEARETADDTARTRVDELSRELERRDRVEAEQKLAAKVASDRVRASERRQMLYQAIALVLASGAGALITHLAHVLAH